MLCFNQQGFRLQRSHAYQPRVKPWERGQRDGCVLKERRRGVDRAHVRRSERCGVPSERGDWGRGRPRALLWAGMHCPCGANGCPCSCLNLLRGRGCFGEFRGCRSCLAQPPANGWHPSGMAGGGWSCRRGRWIRLAGVGVARGFPGSVSPATTEAAGGWREFSGLSEFG